MEPIGIVERLGRWSSGRGALYLLLAARIRALIDDGELTAGAALPPDRALASALAVGRSTVVAAYDLLAAEGRIVRRQGSGTRVAGPASAAPRPTTGAPGFLHLLEPRDRGAARLGAGRRGRQRGPSAAALPGVAGRTQRGGPAAGLGLARVSARAGGVSASHGGLTRSVSPSWVSDRR